VNVFRSLRDAWHFAWRLHNGDPNVNAYEAERKLVAFYAAWILADACLLGFILALTIHAP